MAPIGVWLRQKQGDIWYCRHSYRLKRRSLLFFVEWRALPPEAGAIRLPVFAIITWRNECNVSYPNTDEAAPASGGNISDAVLQGAGEPCY